MARALSTGAESFAQHGRIALAAGTSVEDEDVLAHGVSSCAVICGTVICWMVAWLRAYPAGSGWSMLWAPAVAGVAARACGEEGVVMPSVFFRRTDERCRVRMHIFVIITKKMSIPLSHLLLRDSRQEK